MFKKCCGCKNSKSSKKDTKEDLESTSAKSPEQETTVPSFTKQDSTMSKNTMQLRKENARDDGPESVPKCEITGTSGQTEISFSKDRTAEATGTSNPENKPHCAVEISKVVASECSPKPTESKSDSISENKSSPEVTGTGTGTVVESQKNTSRQSSEEHENENDVRKNVFAMRGILATPHPGKRASMPALTSLPRWWSQEDDDTAGEGGGTAEPPATPVGRDELALRRHRFFSDLLHVAQAGAEHRVRFDPLGPVVAGGVETEPETDIRAHTTELTTLLTRLEQVANKLEKTVIAQEHFLKVIQSTLIPASINMNVSGYNNIITGPLDSFLKTSKAIGGDVELVSKLAEKAFQEQYKYLLYAAQNSPPEECNQQQLLNPTSVQISAIQDLKTKSREAHHANHLSAISESIVALAWVTVSPAPAPFIKEMIDAGQFFTNRVLKEWKEKDKIHVEWVKSWLQTLTDLQQFVKQYHTTGLVWGKKTAGGIPPPPPAAGLPPPPPLPVDEVVSVDISQDRSALFAEINKGEGITANLKKVSPEMQTHKNAALRGGPAPSNISNVPAKSVTPSTPVIKPPIFCKEGKKWSVEYQKGNHNLVIEKDVEMNNVVYIFKCEDSTVTIKGKINSVVLDSCRKSSLLFDSVVSSVEFVNCQSVQMQVLGTVPTISIDKTDGCQMYLSSESLNVEIVSSKSSEMNVMVPKGNGDYVEYPVPEQFKTTIKSQGLLTVAVENKG